MTSQFTRNLVFFSQVALHTCACEARKMSAKYREEKRVFKRPVRTSRSYSTGLNHLWERLFVNRCESLACKRINIFVNYMASEKLKCTLEPSVTLHK